MTSKQKKTKEEPSAKSFEALMEELDQIVDELEGGELSLERSIELFENGMALAKEGTRKLDAAEKRVELLLKQDGEETTVPFEPQEDGRS